MGRLTVDISDSLHKRARLDCARDGKYLSDVIRAYLYKEFHNSKRSDQKEAEIQRLMEPFKMKTYIALVEPGDKATAYGISFPDLPGVYSAADDEGGILHKAIEALQLWAEDESMPEPSTMAAVLQRKEVRAAMKKGCYPLAVPFIENDKG
ncbi:type II toxin-antitoxin system HicB family antitoxin [Sinorhizobium sp. 7-81]|uniref:type II toxin-antitoxin system HicB family antitoxin n=1 Tax=Sinorhizobium sp. 8-89 TaxID=3049089 RepID=UPI0024C23D60|nr:type II toxin-antitoxin system HicB family antitoxin [Sinorhizobium sp. 8-89]MDK1490505.1 type II toxin-antitoxin system HicB family antitoxin [Sinorhizobium sp. 8-89]